MAGSGSEQFLGRILQDQAKALQDIVLQGALQVQAIVDMKDALDRTIPKFAIPSEVLREQKSPDWGLNNPGYTFTSHMNGTIRLKLTFRNGLAGQTIYLKRNGVQVATITQTTGTFTKSIDVNVVDEDVLNLESSYGVLEKIQVCYDLLPKPNMSL